MSDNLTPLEVCFRLFGGREAVERIAGSRPKGAYAWARPSSLRRAGDLPPHVQRKMLAHARRAGVRIEPVWLIEGATLDAVDPRPQVAVE